MQLGFKLNPISISEVTINGTTYSKLNFEGSINSSQKGYAELPILTSAVQLPATKNVLVEAMPGNYTEYQLKYPLLPSRGTIYRNQNPALIPYVIDPNSVVDAWYPGNFAQATDPFIYRDVRGTTVSVNAIQYNAVKKLVRVYGAITVKMTENNSTAINPLEAQTRAIASDMAPVYDAMFVNFNRAAFPNEITAEHGDILVVRTTRDASAIKPYVNWKKQMGYNVFEKEVAVGTNVKSTIATEYGQIFNAKQACKRLKMF
jgi:Propeptide_C25